MSQSVSVCDPLTIGNETISQSSAFFNARDLMSDVSPIRYKEPGEINFVFCFSVSQMAAYLVSQCPQLSVFHPRRGSFETTD